jgi:hypothetical protein
MRDRMLQVLLFAMVFVETVRGIADVREYLRVARKRGNGGHLRSWRRRYLEWGAFAAVCAIAVVPSLYYAVHAGLA